MSERRRDSGKVIFDRETVGVKVTVRPLTDAEKLRMRPLPPTPRGTGTSKP